MSNNKAADPQTSLPGEVQKPGPEDVRLPSPTPSEFRSSSPAYPGDPMSSEQPNNAAVAAPSLADDIDASTSQAPIFAARPSSDALHRHPTKDSPTEASEEQAERIRGSVHTRRSEEEHSRERSWGRSLSRESHNRSTRSPSPALLPTPRHSPTRIPPAASLGPRPRSFSRNSSPDPSLNIRVRQTHPQRRERPRPPISSRIRRALGIATPRASLIWRLAFGATQIVVISVLLGLASRAGSAKPIPDESGGLVMVAGENQWEACKKPIGTWDIVWAAKALLGMSIAVWEYWRAIRPSVDQLLAVEQAQLRREARVARQSRGSRQPRSSMPRDSGAPEVARGDSPIVWTRGETRAADLDMIDAAMLGTPRSMSIVGRMQEIRATRAREERWYSRCSSFQALYGLVWFVAANILIYGTLDTCRWTSPYIWWLTFGLVGLGYVVVAEMLAVAIVVFVLGPLIYLTINMILVCMGRHPMQPGGRMAHINPDVPKMPRTLVDRIPLVMYIPVPVREEQKAPQTAPEPGNQNTVDGIQVEHVYPPAPLASPPPAKTKIDASTPAPAPTSTRTRRRFFFFRRKKNRPAPSGGNEENKGGEEIDLEAGWERNEYPFVKLEANRAACAVCLMDFEPPKRIGDKGKSKEQGKGKGEEEEKAEGSGGGTGEAAEPLRLLACGHVFHRECLDPWLVDVSGRCPTCQRPVEEDDLDPADGDNKKKKPRQT